MSDQPTKPTAPATKEADTLTLREEIFVPQRDGTNVVYPAGHVLPMADAKRLIKAGVLTDTGRQAKKEEK